MQLYNICNWKLTKCYCHQKQTKCLLKFKDKESKCHGIFQRMDSWRWSKPQRLNLIWLSFKLHSCVVQLIYLNIALDVVTLGWTKVNVVKSFQNLMAKFLQCSAAGNLPNYSCNKKHAIQGRGSQRSNSDIFRYVPMSIHNMMITTISKNLLVFSYKLQVTVSDLKQHPFLPSLSFWNKVSSKDSE